MRSSLPLFRSSHFMLLGLVLALAVAFYIGGSRLGKTIEDTYHDPHREAALHTFEAAIVFAPAGQSAAPLSADRLREKFPTLKEDALAGLVDDLQTIDAKLRKLGTGKRAVRFDLERWPGVTPVTPSRLVEAADWLAANHAQRLDELNWPGLRRVRVSQPMQVPATVFQQDNPWRGADGCIYLRAPQGNGLWYLDEQRGHGEICPKMTPLGVAAAQVLGIQRSGESSSLAKDAPAWAIPESLGAVLADLNGLITNDKFCVSRFARLALAQPRYEAGRRRTVSPARCPSAETDFQGGSHGASMANSATDDRGGGRPAPLGPGLPAVAGMEPWPDGTAASPRPGDGT